ncbi:hypothetical protein K2173_016822 [Erythroxylum novogranatense]|uniref:non-specific serine/threonine protein kinase n=1 Tax=Erythroxylum novogranatense TaxID=1862640 RepID=A0AAV8SHT9_9ROSI|nr:hypothetical protein K2173_016822 [Erythroxylum novogranatense]
MKIVQHPIVRLHEICIFLEFVTGGEVFDRIVHHGRLLENEARRYFQQLIDAVSHCHSKGVYHRDLKIAYFGWSAIPYLLISLMCLFLFYVKGVELLHITYGTPNYGVPAVLSYHGYDGAATDVWSCGVILYVLMAGYLPFEESGLPTLFQRINCEEYTCLFWFSLRAKALIDKILDPNPKNVKTCLSSFIIVSHLMQRIKIQKIKQDPWSCKNYVPVTHNEEEEVNLDDVRVVFNDIKKNDNIKGTSSRLHKIVLKLDPIARCGKVRKGEGVSLVASGRREIGFFSGLFTVGKRKHSSRRGRIWRPRVGLDRSKIEAFPLD